MERGISLGKKIGLVLGLVSIILVSGLGYFWYSNILETRESLIGVITIEGALVSYEDIQKYTGIINQAIINDSVKAVVLRIDSPGGYAHYVEDIYLDLLKLKEVKPLVTTASTALSGGYYISVAAEQIFVNPTSMIGNVGVIGTGPPVLVPSESALETGAHKVTGFSKLYFPFNLTHALDNFVTAVMSQRGDRLDLNSTELRRGSVFLGSEAVKAGLADDTGSLQKAIQFLAEDAKLKEYRIVNLNQAYETIEILHPVNKTKILWNNLNFETLNRLHPPPALFYLYLPSLSPYHTTYSTQWGVDQDSNNITERDVTADVIVDLSHGNKISAWDLDIIMAELAKNNKTLGFISDWDNLESKLDYVSSLIIAAPTHDYSVDETKKIKDFVKSGRTLYLFCDPATGYIETPNLHGPINSVANQFGISYAKGYLYNEREHFGFYRNIYVKDFVEGNITKGLNNIVFFTATHIYTNNELAWTSNETYSSTAEKTDKYNVISLTNLNGTVIAIGDLTFMKEPYCYVEDNYKLIHNLIDVIETVKTPEKIKDEQVEEALAKPDLAVGTEKTYIENVDGEEQRLRWYKVSETEILFERPNRTTHYYLNEASNLLGWESNGLEAWYETPLPDAPYPLNKGEIWDYKSNYNLTTKEEVIPGIIEGEEKVIGFEDIRAENGILYRCAKINYIIKDLMNKSTTQIEVISEGTSWMSKEAGVIKEEANIKTYVNEFLVDEEIRKRILTSITKD